MTTNFRQATPDALKKAGPPLVSLKVSFGPKFSEQKLSNREFIDRLRAESKLHPKSFLSTMMSHFSDHLEAAAEAGLVSLDDTADTDPNTTYYGQGSCTGCPGDNGSGDNCCLCEYNGQYVGCESC